MQDTEDLIWKGLDVLGKILDDKPEPEEPDMGGKGPEPPEQTTEPIQDVVDLDAHTVEQDYDGWFDHLIHHAPTLLVAAVTALGLIAVAWLNNRRKKKAPGH